MSKILLTIIGGTSPGTKPLATSLLSAVLKSKGHEVVLFDTTFMDLGFELGTEISSKTTQFKAVKWKEYNLVRDSSINAKQVFIEMIEREQPDIIASNALTDMFYHTVQFLTLAKERFDIPVILGGIHSTLNPEDAIKHDCIDCICVGEGEYIINDLVNALINGGDLSTVNNIWYKENGKIKKNALKPLCNLDNLPYLDFTIYDERQFQRPFQGKILRSGDVQDMRGCPRKCTYCANSRLNLIYKNRVRAFSPERFVDEIEFLTKTHNLEFYKFFSEDTLLRNVDDLAKLSELYAKKAGVPFTAHAHPKSVTKEKAKLMKQMNCASLSIALESGNYHYRKNVLARRYTNNELINAVRTVEEAGIRVSLLTMIGLPYESRKMIFETIDVCRKAKAQLSNCGIFFPYPGTPLGDLTIKEDFADINVVRKSKFDVSKTLLDMPQIHPQEVEGIRKMWSFYINYPKFLFPLFRWMENSTPIKGFILNILQLIENRLKFVRKTN